VLGRGRADRASARFLDKRSLEACAQEVARAVAFEPPFQGAIKMNPERRPLPQGRSATAVSAEPESSCSAETRDVALDLIDESDLFRLRCPPYPGIEALADSILRSGQSTPLFLRPRESRFELISGYRRLSALKLIRARAAYCRIYRDISDEAAYDLAIGENQDRDNLTDIERADICLRLKLEGKTAEQIARRMRWTNDRNVFLHVRVAKEASPAIRSELQARRVSFTLSVMLVEEKIRELGEDAEREILDSIIEGAMSVREARTYVARTRRARSSSTHSRTAHPETTFLRELQGGAFTITARIDPSDPAALDAGLKALALALKRGRELKRRNLPPDVEQPDAEAKRAPERARITKENRS
jgi:ParB-like chromosome segregation protein Spo0J